MSIEIAKPTARISSGFRRIVDVFLAGEGLPFSQILAAERIERICGQHGCLFGRHGIFSTPVVLWAFLSQVLRDGKEAACQAAAIHGKQPRQISFTAACQYILSAWMLLSASRTPAAALRELRLRLLGRIASCEVANRPGRDSNRVS